MRLLICLAMLAMSGHASADPPAAKAADGLAMPSAALCMSRLGDGFLVGCGRQLVLADGNLKGLRPVANAKQMVHAVAVSPDGRTVAYACDGVDDDPEFIRVADSTFKVLHQFAGEPKASVVRLVFDSAGKVLVVSAYRSEWKEYRTRYFDLATGKQTFPPGAVCEGVAAVAHTPDGKRMAVALGDGRVRVVTTDDYKEVGVLEHEDYVSQMAVIGGGRYLACAGLFQDVYVWDLGTLKLHRKLRIPDRVVATVATDGSSDRVAAGGSDGSVQVWDAKTGDELLGLSGSPCQGHTQVGVAADGKRVMAADSGKGDARLRSWDVPSK